jgi:cell division protein FtsX
MKNPPKNSLAHILIIIVALALVGFIFAYPYIKKVREAYTINSASNRLESRQHVTMVIYFAPSAKDTDTIRAVVNEIKARPEVKTAVYTSHEQALEEFKALHRDDEKLTEALKNAGDNPLGAKLEVTVHNTNELQPLYDYALYLAPHSVIASISVH